MNIEVSDKRGSAAHLIGEETKTTNEESFLKRRRASATRRHGRRGGAG